MKLRLGAWILPFIVTWSGCSKSATTACSPATCAGCCNGNVCEPGTTAASCGAQGEACSVCSATSICSAGICSANDATDGGVSDSGVGQPVMGRDWIRVVQTAPFGSRANLFLTPFAGELWVMGGTTSSTSLSDVWHSSDAVNWVAATGQAAFGGTNTSSGCASAFNGSLWVLGINNTWSSTDGATWTQQTSSTHPSIGALCLAWGSNLWTVAGNGALWSSPDGLTWTQTDAGSGTQSSLTGAAVLNNVLYATINHGVSATTDGKSWLPKNLSVSVAQFAVANGALWTIDGSGAVRTSTDGVTWQTVGSAASIVAGTGTAGSPGSCEQRLGYGFTAFTPAGSASQKLVIVGGSEYCFGPPPENQAITSYLADVWISPP